MVLDDALIANLTAVRNRPVIETKAKGASILDRLTRSDDLDLFLLFSSATTLVGNPGQSNYVAANGYLEGLARARRTAGLPALAVGFGAISDTGFLQRNGEVGHALARRIGRTAMTAREAFRFLDGYMAQDPGTIDAAVFTLAEIDWNAAGQLATVRLPLLAEVARSSQGRHIAGEGQRVDLHELVAGKSAEDGERAVFELVAAEIAAVLKISAGEITPTRIIRDIGLDSLMAMELDMNFRQRTGMEMPLSSVTQATTVADVAHKLYLRIAAREDAGGDIAELLDDLAGRHAEDRGVASA
jgi:acyl carrier protein